MRVFAGYRDERSEDSDIGATYIRGKSDGVHILTFKGDQKGRNTRIEFVVGYEKSESR
jgi:hypothetical protein